MGGAASVKVLARFIQAQLAVDRQADFRGISVFLAVVFPPAHRAQRERAGRLQRPVPAARAAITSLRGYLARIDMLGWTGLATVGFTRDPARKHGYPVTKTGPNWYMRLQIPMSGFIFIAIAKSTALLAETRAIQKRRSRGAHGHGVELPPRRDS